MLAHVGEGLLYGAEHHHLVVSRQAVEDAAHLYDDLDAGLLLEPAGHPSYRLGERGLLERRRAEGG